jgi:hypothetical protein
VKKKTKRAHQTTTKVQTPFRGVFVHVTWDASGAVVGASLSHQQKDFGSPIAELLDTISNGLCAAIKAGPFGGEA